MRPGRVGQVARRLLMTWIDGSVFRGDRASEMAKVLANEYRDDASIHMVLQNIGAQELLRTGSLRLELLWFQIICDLHSTGDLPRLLDHVVEQSPRLKTRLDDLSADPPPGRGNPADRYAVLFTRTGNIPIIDRDRLRLVLRAFIQDRLPAVIIRGDAQTGKTHSFELLKHVLEGCDEPRHIKINFSSAICGSTATELMIVMRSRLGLPPLSRGRVKTSSSLHHAADMVNSFVGDYNKSLNAASRRILVIDGVDRPDIDSNVPIMVAMLIAECVDQQLLGCQLFVTGFDGDLDRQIRFAVQEDVTSPITTSHVRAHLSSFARELGTELDTDSLSKMVRTVMRHEPDLRLIADAIQTVSLNLVGAR